MKMEGNAVLKNLFLVALLFWAVLGDPPQPKIPETFEATGEIHAQENGTKIVGVGRWGFDQPKGKGVLHFEFGPRHHRNIHEVLRYDLGKSFRVEHMRHCITKDVKPPMPTTWLWARSAKFNGTQQIFNRTLNMWVGQDGQLLKTVGVADGAPNVPIFFQQVDPNVGGIEIHFWRFETKQPNPDWFDIPPACNQSLPFVTPKLQSTIQRLSKSINVTLPSDVCNKAASCAKTICGTCHCPYVYGGESDCCSSHKGGLDCSGLVQYSYVHCGGYSGMPRTTFQMWSQLKEGCGSCSPSNTGACHVGDLFFYYPSSQGPDHVVMYIGGGQVAECPHTGEDCRILHPYTSSYVGCKRLC